MLHRRIVASPFFDRRRNVVVRRDYDRKMPH